MGNYVSHDQIRAARRADLHAYLLRNHHNDIEVDGDTIRLKCNHSICVRRGYSGWKDFANDDHGNGIDLLTRFLGYDFQRAVRALAGDCFDPVLERQPPEPAPAPDRPFNIPAQISGPYRQLYAYLCQTRRIPRDTVQNLVNAGLLYQTDRGNMVFLNANRTFCEIRGTNTYKAYHQVQFNAAHPEAYWSFKPSQTAPATGSILLTKPTIYICEGAIDAISLSLLHLTSLFEPTSLYAAIGGVANQQRIDQIKLDAAAMGGTARLAVDNDAAGEACRQRNRDCTSVIPQRKDWNEDWCAQVRGKKVERINDEW